MPDYAALAAEIAQPAYAGMDDAKIAATINAAEFTAAAPIRATEVKRLWGRRMILARCWVAAEDAGTAADVRALCRATYDNLMQDLFADLDPADPTQAKEITAYLDGLVAAGMMTDQDRQDTLALAVVPRTGDVVFLGRPIDESDIKNARGAK